MNITGSIDGLKKGTLYLQKISDSLIKNVDSIEIDGNNDFKLGDNITDSEVELYSRYEEMTFLYQDHGPIYKAGFRVSF